MNNSVDMEEDDIVFEIPVFYNKPSSSSSYHILEFVTVPPEYGKPPVPTKSRIKPACGLVELDFPIEENNNIDDDKSASIAMLVDRKAKEKTFESGKMDHITYQGLLREDTLTDCAAIIDEEGLHLTPIASHACMKTDFGFYDKVDEQANEPQEEVLREIGARFQRNETERAKMLRERTSRFYRTRVESEQWVDLQYKTCKKTGRGNPLEDYLCCSEVDAMLPSYMEKKDYLDSLLNIKGAEETIPFQGKLYTPEKAVEIVLKTCHIARFQTLMTTICSERTEEQLLSLLSELATLVQGIWVIKSSLVFEPSVDAALLEKARLADEQSKEFRDTILCWLALYKEFNLEDLSPPSHMRWVDVLDVINNVATIRKGKVQLRFPTDESFIKKYPKLNREYLSKWKAFNHKITDNAKGKKKT